MKKIVMAIFAMIICAMGVANLDFHEITIIISHLNINLVILSIIMQLITIGLISYQRMKTCCKFAGDVSFLKVLSINFYEIFYEGIIPTVKFGKEKKRVSMLKNQCGIDISKGIIAVSIQKIISIGVFIGVTTLNIIFATFYVTGNKYLSTILSSSSIILIILGTLFTIMIIFGKSISDKVSTLKVVKKYTSYIIDIDNLFKFDKDKLRQNAYFILKQISLSIAIWALYAFKCLILARALGINDNYILITVATYISYGFAKIPLLPSGIGSFEVMMVIFMSTANINLEVIILLAILIRLVTFWFEFILSSIFVGLKESFLMKSKVISK